MLMAMVKKRITVQSQESAEDTFAELLTPYALSYVKKKIVLQKKVTAIKDHDENCIISSSAGILTVTADSCQCTSCISHVNTYLLCGRRCIYLYLAQQVCQRGGKWHICERFIQESQHLHHVNHSRQAQHVIKICTCNTLAFLHAALTDYVSAPEVSQSSSCNTVRWV